MKLTFIILLLAIIIFGIYFISARVTRKNKEYVKPDLDPVQIPEHIIKGVAEIMNKEKESNRENPSDRVILTGSFESAKSKIRKPKVEKTQKDLKNKDPKEKSGKRKYTPRKKKKGDKGDDLLLS